MNIDTINLGILAHVDAGKTTVTEGLLYYSGAVKRMGNVDKGTTVADFHFEQGSNKLSLRLFGKLQMEIIAALLLERYGLRVVFQPPTTVYKLRPAVYATGEIRIGNAFHLPAGVALSIEPLPLGSGIQYESRVSYGYVEKPFQAAVHEGVLHGLSTCLPLEVSEARVCFVDADYNSVVSTPAAFRSLTPEVIRLALQAAGTEQLEPWMAYRLTAPLGAEKRIFSDLFKMRATTGEILYGEQELRITGEVPFDTCNDFLPILLSYTGGKGIFEVQFLQYRPCLISAGS